jgi:hypothetical protein
MFSILRFVAVFSYLVSFGLPSVRLPCIFPFEIFFGFFDLDLEPLCRCVSFIWVFRALYLLPPLCPYMSLLWRILICAFSCVGSFILLSIFRSKAIVCMVRSKSIGPWMGYLHYYAKSYCVLNTSTCHPAIIHFCDIPPFPRDPVRMSATGRPSFVVFCCPSWRISCSVSWRKPQLGVISL